ncbi:MAG: STAS domain-containing protein [Magnetococcales bacterium]|nr:STAS domain-containing protein [Magnetococcales bacterium]MBF0583053.1 STAS domain-containing protein [Magnetococcales bacterium]
MEFSRDDNGDAGHLVLSGALTIQQALPLKELLLRAGGEVKNLTINLEQVERVDLTALQLLCAAHRDWIKRGKHCTLQGNIPEIFRRVVQEAGFTGCAGDGDDMRLWTGVND